MRRRLGAGYLTKADHQASTARWPGTAPSRRQAGSPGSSASRGTSEADRDRHRGRTLQQARGRGLVHHVPCRTFRASLIVAGACRRTSSSRRSGCRHGPTPSRSTCPPVSGSGCRWPPRWRGPAGCCWSTSRSRAWTPGSGRNWRACCLSTPGTAGRTHQPGVSWWMGLAWVVRNVWFASPLAGDVCLRRTARFVVRNIYLDAVKGADGAECFSGSAFPGPPDHYRSLR